MSDELILKGLGVSHGIAEGIVRIALEAKNIPDFEEGQILVAKYTEPSMVLMMNKAAGFITDIGGLTSHAAIIAREIGVPCIANTKNATSLLTEGMRVRINGDTGEIYAL